MRTNSYPSGSSVESGEPTAMREVYGSAAFAERSKQRSNGGHDAPGADADRGLFWWFFGGR
jgi:hypothetical protein